MAIGKKRWKTAPLAASALLLTAMTACSGGNSGGDNASPSASAPQPSASGSAPASASASAAQDGPFGKYDPPIELTTVRAVNAGVKFQGDDSYDSNIWTKDFESQLGIKVVNKWKVSDQQYPNKLTVTIVSGDVPDFMLVDAQQFQTLVQAGQLADIGPIFDQYATDLSKSSLDEANGIKRAAGTVDGKMYGIAADGGGRDDANMLYIREDWLKNLGLQPPKTMDEFIQVATAFAKDDPDKNGKDDTYGFAMESGLWGGWAGLDGFFNGYHAYPYNPGRGSGTNLMFLKGADGKAMWADIQPEVKTALGKLQELYKDGVLYPEFSVIDGVKAGELATSGKVGMSFGSFFVPTWPINNMKNEDPNVDWGVYPIVSADDKPVMAQGNSVVPTKFYVVSKKAKHPEAVIKLFNYVNEKLYGPDKDIKYHTVQVGDTSYPIQMYPPIEGSFADKNQNYFDQLKDAFAADDASGLDEEAQLYFDQVKQYEDGNLSLWSAYKLWAPGGVFDRLGQYKQDNRIMTTAYLGSPTPTMVSRGPALRDLEVQAFTEIIMGSRPLDAFDEFAKQWQEQGGADILDEVNSSGLLQ